MVLKSRLALSPGVDDFYALRDLVNSCHSIHVDFVRVILLELILVVEHSVDV